MSEKIWFLKRCDLFERLTPQQKRRLESTAVMRTFRNHEIIYFPTEPGQSVLVLARGRVKLKALGPEGQETILAFIGEGELFGELALVDSEPRNEYAEAVEESVVLAVPREDMLWLMSQRAEVALHVTKLLGFRRRRIENRLRNILFRSNRERIVALLQELLEAHGRRDGDAWEIGLALSHQELASLIGATRETVTLTLGRLQYERLIEVRRRRIRVLDREALAAQASGNSPPLVPRRSRVPRKTSV
jgi:CRP/FNR family transcriptional regulator, cyclic AMP receptor protein